MGANIASAVFNFLVLVFFIVVAIGIALSAYAATQMKKMEEKLEK